MKRLITFILAFLIFGTLTPVMAAENSSSRDKMYSTDTLLAVNTFDFVADSVTGVTKNPYSKDKIKSKLASYGAKYAGLPGMPYDEYKAAMNSMWTDYTDYRHEPEMVSVNISEAYTYRQLCEFMKKLSRYEGVYMYMIGESTKGKKMYALEIDVPSKYKKKTIVLTGNVHARETAGSVYIIKQLAGLLQTGTKKSENLLKKFRIVAVPCVNPDGRDGVAFNTDKYTYSSGALWKATSDGTDIGRNFPALGWSQVGKGYKQTDMIHYTPDKILYPGPNAGSAPETKALMKLLYYYVVVEKASVLIDYHQQGSLGYAGKPWDLKKHQKACKKLANYLFSYMNEGNKREYKWEKEEESYGLNGTGSTLGDYASSIAYGAKFSPAYGFCVYTDGEHEYPLSAIPRMEDNTIELIDEPNPSFVTMTFEIGYGKEYIGYGSEARKLMAQEYTDYHFGTVLYRLADYLR